MVYSAIQVLHVNVLVIIKDQVIITFIGQIYGYLADLYVLR